MKITRKKLQEMISKSIKAISSGSPSTAQKAMLTFDDWQNAIEDSPSNIPANRRETDPAVADMLEDMWKATNLSSWEKYWKLSKQGSDDGAWSAAFVSFVEDDPGFNDSIRHSDYMKSASEEREKFNNGEDMNGKHVAFKDEEIKAMPGDKRCYNRIGGKHCDVCLEPDCVSFIGGNLNNDIRIRTDSDSPAATMIIAKSPLPMDDIKSTTPSGVRTIGPKTVTLEEILRNENKMKITRKQLRRLIKEELKAMQAISEDLSSLPEEQQSDIINDVHGHVLEMIVNAWPNADHVPGAEETVKMVPGKTNEFTLTYEFMTTGTGTGLAGLRGIERKWKNKVAGKAGYRSEFFDNTGNKVFKMQLAQDPIKWSSEEGERKDSDGYVSLTVLITLNEDFVGDPGDLVDV